MGHPGAPTCFWTCKAEGHPNIIVPTRGLCHAQAFREQPVAPYICSPSQMTTNGNLEIKASFSAPSGVPSKVPIGLSLQWELWHQQQQVALGKKVRGPQGTSRQRGPKPFWVIFRDPAQNTATDAAFINSSLVFKIKRGHWRFDKPEEC